MRLPVVYGAAADMVIAEAEKLIPDVILCIGLAGARRAIMPERIAVNIRDAHIADNAGKQFSGEPAAEGAPAAYFSTLPVKQMADAIRACGIPSAVSNSAGAFVCNDVLYLLLHHFHGTKTRVGFIHVPNTPPLGSPEFTLDAITSALKAAIEVL